MITITTTLDPVRDFERVPDSMNLRPSQSCNVLGCSLPTYYRWGKQGRLRIIKVGPGVSGTPAGDIRRLLAGEGIPAAPFASKGGK